MAKITAEIKLSELDIVKDLFELLSDGIECIQEPLKSKLLDWVEAEDKGWVKWSDIAPEFINNQECIVMMNGAEQMQVTGYNRILQKVELFDKELRCLKIVDAKSFSIKNIGFENFVSWG